MIYLRQSTASQEIPLGRFVDSTDGDSEEVSLTIANTDIKLWKTGATTLASKNSGGATHIANGEYYCVLDATDTDTIGPMRVAVHVAGALAVQVWCCVLDEAVYDVMFGTTAPSTYAGADTSGTTTLLSRIGGAITISGGRVDANATYWNGSAVATPDTAGYPKVTVKSGTGTGELSLSSGQVLLQAGTGTGQLDFTSGVVKANATQWLGGTIPAVNTTGVPKVDLILWLGTAPLALSSQQVQAVVPVTQKVDVETIKTQTVTCAAGVTVGAFVGQGTAAIGVNASGHVSRVVLCDTITTYTGDTPQTGDSYAIVNSGTHGNAAIKGYVDDIGTAGAGLTAVPWNAAWDAEVQSECADALTAFGASTLTAAQVNTEVDTALADVGLTSTITGRIDAAISTRLASASYTSPLDAAGTRTAVGLASANLDTQLSTIAGYVDTEVSSIKAVTDKLDTMLVSDTGTGADQYQFDRWAVDQVWSVGTRTLTSGVAVSSMDAGVITTLAIADSAITDAKIAVPTETAGRPTGILAMMRRIWEWTTNDRNRNRTTGVVTLRNAANSADLESQTQSTAGVVDTQSKGV